jgi:predicted nucleic acid-binding protein
MSALLDSSVVIAAIVESEPYHGECAALLAAPGALIYQHALAEIYSYLTGGHLTPRVPPELAVEIVQDAVLRGTKVIELKPAEVLKAMQQCQQRGVRGGAIYDYLHLVAARKAGAERIYTLNVRDFRAFHRSGDPTVTHPDEKGN